MTGTEAHELSPHPRPPGRAGAGARPHLDARTTGWLLEQRARIRSLELQNARLAAELDCSARVERGAQRACDRLEAELERARRREATLARALGYAEAQRDQLARRLGSPASPRAALPARTPRA